MKTTDEAYRQYVETLARICGEFDEAKKKAKATLNANLKEIRATLHEENEELKALVARQDAHLARERVKEMARLMGKPIYEPLDEELAKGIKGGS